MSDDTDENRFYDNERFHKRRPPEEPLDYAPSSGAKESHKKEFDETAPQSHDGRARTRTKFYPEEGSDNIDYERLAILNDGLHSENRKQRYYDAERRRDMDIFCSTLNLHENDKERCQYLLQKIDDVRTHKSGEVAILAIISLVANENERMIRQEETFQELCDSCNVTRSQIRNSRKKLRTNL